VIANLDNRFLSILWKLDRADRLIGELRAGRSALARTVKFRGLRPGDPRSTSKRVWLEGYRVPAPYRFYGVTADLIHNLRSALDQLAWQLSGCPSPSRARPSFPVRLIPPGPGKQLPELRLMTARAVELVDSLQPYNNLGSDDPLWVLNDLWNQDKHRHMPLVSIAVWTHIAEIGPRATSLIPKHGDLVNVAFARGISDGIRIRKANRRHLTLAFAVTHDARSGRNLLQGASEMLSYVRDRVLPLFDRVDCFRL